MSAGTDGAFGQQSTQQPSRGRWRAVWDAGQSAEELRAEIAGFRAQFEEASRADRQEVKQLGEQIAKLQNDFETERKKRLVRRLLGLGPPPPEDTEKTRERMRGLLAVGLVLALVVLMVLTFLYLLMLSRKFGDLTTDDLIALIPMVGTTLLTPLVGLIGAVMGFYYGGQTAVSAASQTAEATKQATQSASKTAAQAASSTAAQMGNG